MSDKTLAELVTMALAGSEATSKVASLRASEPLDPGDEFLAEALGQTIQIASELETPKVASAPAASSTTAMDDASYGMKLASALRGAADMVKVAFAMEPAQSSGEHINEHGTHPKTQDSVAGKAIPSSVGPQGSLPNDGDKPATGTGPSNHPGKVAADRKATERVLNAKLAEHRMLVSMGHTEAADKAAAEAKELETKLASGPGSLDTSDGGKGGVPMTLSNEALINMTKGQARNASVQQAASMLRQPVKVPNDIAANVGRTDGVKVSGVVGALLPGIGPAIEDKEHRVSSGLRSYGGAVAGGLAGSIPGAALMAAGAKLKSDKLVGAGAGLTMGGSLAGQLYGGHKGQESARAKHKRDQEAKKDKPKEDSK